MCACVLPVLNNASYLGFRVYDELCHILPHSVLTIVLVFLCMVHPSYYFPHFGVGVTRMERGEVICPRSHT